MKNSVMFLSFLILASMAAASEIPEGSEAWPPPGVGVPYQLIVDDRTNAPGCSSFKAFLAFPPGGVTCQEFLELNRDPEYPGQIVLHTEQGCTENERFSTPFLRDPLHYPCTHVDYVGWCNSPRQAHFKARSYTVEGRARIDRLWIPGAEGYAVADSLTISQVHLSCRPTDDHGILRVDGSMTPISDCLDGTAPSQDCFR